MLAAVLAGRTPRAADTPMRREPVAESGPRSSDTVVARSKEKSKSPPLSPAAGGPVPGSSVMLLRLAHLAACS